MTLDRTRRGKGVAGALLAGVLALTVASPAYAHATYKSSDPADNSTVSSPPSEVWAEFTEPMEEGSYMVVTDPCGREVGSTESHLANEMTAQMNGAASGTYRVFWRAVSIDGHTTEGEFTFTSSGGEPCSGEEPAESSNEGGESGAGGGSDQSGSGTTVASGGGGDAGGDGASTDGGNSKQGRGDAKAERGRDGERKDRSELLAARRPERDQPAAPSALDGIPVGGLLVTLAISALIGAAAGKIYVSLSGESS